MGDLELFLIIIAAALAINLPIMYGIWRLLFGKRMDIFKAATHFGSPLWLAWFEGKLKEAFIWRIIFTVYVSVWGLVIGFQCLIALLLIDEHT